MDSPSEVYIVKQKINGVSSRMVAFYSIHEAYSNASKLRSQNAHIDTHYVDCVDMEKNLKSDGECFLWTNGSDTWIKVFVLKIEDSQKTFPWLKKPSA
jgi:hypothetical protein